ncbi:MAG: glutamine-hydrolyzing carbamoyl-phosphate synthase small subunit [Dethiobacter sp.]|jgi:carbamoyl-phosphate synthase small subunit|nr:glutamine-hydrolyzing carbamoyl-phosphate synthase small subunit [Dethiobacter sp.]MBS3899814.1 glutamine-hydrolyzing carbamoyl-phosphate synthase small subunit [Dethiobacter sp.]MCL4463394.1 glutamine-hydrolyzing carbamoyl-phosphate synthase small subunit [Bacillota bacterium]
MFTRLALENGEIFYGEGFGASGSCAGEVIFNTAMTGYQEILTDPSYCGQILTMTYPLIGNYGINPVDFESRQPFLRGFVVREACNHPNNWRATETLSAYLKRNNILALSGIDTRALTRIIRQSGAMRGVISTEELDDQELVKRARTAPALSGQNLLNEVTTPVRYTIDGDGPRVVVLDLGLKQSIVKNLSKAGCEVVVVPAMTIAEEILALKPSAMLLSNGPGDPKDAQQPILTVKKLIGKLPLFGVCLGHQILALALGADTYKLKFGHRGANQPVKDLESTKVQITSQNHGYAIDEKTLTGLDITVTHRNLHDWTVEGIRHNSLPIFSVQYHPEAFPGPSDSAHIFQRFLSLMEA